MPKKTFEAAAEAQAHLIVQLKDNQPTLCRKVEAVCNDTKPRSCVQTVDSKKRNRHETRTVAVFGARQAVAGTEWQPHVRAIIAVERRVLTFQPAKGLWNASRETAFYLSNRPIRARKAADAVRNHWGIENKQHYTRDVTLREDASRIRRNPGIFARLRSFAYNILRFNQSDTIPQDRYAAALGGLDLRTGAVKVLLYNNQVSEEMTKKMQTIARDSGVPVVAISETQPPGTTFQEWMLSQLNAFEAALGGNRR